jgi:hypothetical protein
VPIDSAVGFPRDIRCGDFLTREEAQAWLDYCWTQSGLDVHHLDSDGDSEACEPTAVPGAELAMWETTATLGILYRK